MESGIGKVKSSSVEYQSTRLSYEGPVDKEPVDGSA